MEKLPLQKTPVGCWLLYDEFCKKKTALLTGDQQDKIIRRG